MRKATEPWMMNFIMPTRFALNSAISAPPLLFVETMYFPLVSPYHEKV